MIDWIQTNSAFVVAIATVVLVFVTAFYAWRTHDLAKSTKQQADASVKMAEEMRAQRMDGVRPVLNIIKYVDIVKDVIALGKEAYADKDKFPQAIPCELENLGLGTAIDVYTTIVDPTSNEHRIHKYGNLAVGQRTAMKLEFVLKPDSGRHALVTYYHDTYGRKFESSREVTVDKRNGWILGPLAVVMIAEELDD